MNQINIQNYRYTVIQNSLLLEYVKNNLPLSGILKRDEISTYIYLKIHDDFILKLFPLLREENICIPGYFPPNNNTGAHISIIYPDEGLLPEINILEIDQPFCFEISELVSIEVFNKAFIALTLIAPKIEALRLKYNLSTQLNYHGLLVPFHITIACKINA